MKQSYVLTYLRQIFIICCLFPALLPAQAPCNYQKLFNEGKAAAKSKNYEPALKKFNSARRCDPNKGQEIDQEIENLYSAINKQKEEAEEQRRLAEIQKKLAEEQTRRAESALDSLRKANTDKVRLILAKAERQREELNFAAAEASLNDARLLLALTDSVDLAYKNLNRSVLYHAREDLRRGDYQASIQKIKIAERLKVQPDSVEAVIQELQRFLFENARVDILNTEYDAALDKIAVVRSLHLSQDSVEYVWFDIAFCSVGTGELDRAVDLLGFIALSQNNYDLQLQLRDLEGKDPAVKTRQLRQIMRQLDTERYDRLLSRYFPPVFGEIPGGKIVMGGEGENRCPVTIQPLQFGTKEVTFFEFDLFCAATHHRKPSDHGWGRGNRPVVDIDWYDALEYCNWRSRQEGLQEVYKIDSSGNLFNRDAGARKCWPVSLDRSANGYRLPTEAEWQFAAENGEKHTRYGWGDALPVIPEGGNVADETTKTQFPKWQVFEGYSDGFAYTAPTGSFSPNDFGLYDMTGNVWEWCWDGYEDDYCRSHKKKRKDPYNGCRVLRGGSWGSTQQDCYVRHRFYNTADTRNFSIGFRLARNQENLTR